MCGIFDWTREEYEAASRVQCNWALALHRVELEAAVKQAKDGGAGNG